MHHAAGKLSIELTRIHANVAIERDRDLAHRKSTGRCRDVGDLRHLRHNTVKGCADSDTAEMARRRGRAPAVESCNRVQHRDPALAGQQRAPELVRILSRRHGQFVDHGFHGKGIDRRSYRSPESHRNRRGVRNVFHYARAQSIGQLVRSF